MGAYVSPERVERDGLLVAFKGETMTEDEAKRRGLLCERPAEAEKPTARRRATRKKAVE